MDIVVLDNDKGNNRVDLIMIVSSSGSSTMIDKLIQSLIDTNLTVFVEKANTITTITITINDNAIDQYKDLINNNIVIQLDVRSLQLSSQLTEYTKQYSGSSSSYNKKTSSCSSSNSSSIAVFNYIYHQYLSLIHISEPTRPY